jgi:hypothetical protein
VYLYPFTPPRIETDTLQRSQLATDAQTTPSPALKPALVPRPPNLPVRQHLKKWQAEHGAPSEEALSAFENHPANNAQDADIRNSISKLNQSSKADEDVETEEWDAHDQDDGEGLVTIGLFLKPGDVVELSQSGREPVLAVFVQQLAGNSQFFSVNGRWCHSTIGRIGFAIPGCIDPALLTPLIPYMPTSPDAANPKGEIHVPIELATPVQKLLERMTEEAEQIYRRHAPVLDTAYAVLADPKRTRMMTLAQIAKILLAAHDPAWTPSPAALLAVRKSLHQNEYRFRSDVRSHRLTNVFSIRSKRDVQNVETVLEWIREHREFLAASANKNLEPGRQRTKGVTYVMDFLAKARRLITASRKDRDPNLGMLGPSKAKLSKTGKSSGIETVSGEPFTSTDKQIIEFLQAWVLTGQFIGMGSLHTACTNLVMATGCYGRGTLHNTGLSDAEASEIRRATGMLFLQEVGVITPFENRSIYDEQLMLPTIRLSRNAELLNTKAEQMKENPNFRDSMADLRRDWGSTAVYCIDDAGAQEIDDGVSIERVNGGTSEFWVHVHVANPTAFFDKAHPLSGLAAHMVETVYTPEQSFPMFPSWAAQGHFSLEPNRPVLTFSTRIDAGGNVLESKIQPGMIQNVVSITPSAVSSLLGHEASHETTRLVVGGDASARAEKHEKPTVSAQQLQDLQDMYTATKGLWQARSKAGGIRMNNTGNNVRVLQSPGQAGLPWTPPSTEQSRHVQGDPIIEVTNRVPENLMHFGISPENIVEEMMLLACSTAASWCNERSIPVMYRGTIEPPNTEAVSSETLRTQVLAHWDKNGDVPRGLSMRYLTSLGRAIVHSAPLTHKYIGVSGYVKVTSPLRRFSDMIAHWQIEAALRYEAESGNKFNAVEATGGTRGVLPFTLQQMQESIVTLSPQERIIASTKRASSRFWSILALARAHYYKEAPLPDVFRFWVRQKPNNLNPFARGAQGFLPDYGYPATFTEATEVQEGDEWEVRLDRVDLFGRLVFVKPIRLLRREEDSL